MTDFKKIHRQRKKRIENLLESFTAQEVFDIMVDIISKQENADERTWLFNTVLSYLTERGYNVIKTASIKEQMELEEWLARQYPHMNERENLYLQY